MTWGIKNSRISGRNGAIPPTKIQADPYQETHDGWSGRVVAVSNLTLEMLPQTIDIQLINMPAFTKCCK